MRKPIKVRTSPDAQEHAVKSQSPGERYRAASVAEAVRDPSLRAAAATMKVAEAYIQASRLGPVEKGRATELMRDILAERLDHGQPIRTPRVASIARPREPEMDRTQEQDRSR